MLFAVVFSSSASVGYTLSAAGAAPRPALQPAGAAPAAAFSGLRLAAARVRMSDEMSEEEFLAMQDAEELVDAEGNVVTQTQELSEGAKRVVRGMRSETGVEFAPWMKVDAEAIARADRERKERKARQAAQAKQLDPYAMDPQAAELGAGARPPPPPDASLAAPPHARPASAARRRPQVKDPVRGRGGAEVVHRQRGGQRRLHRAAATGRCPPPGLLLGSLPPPRAAPAPPLLRRHRCLRRPRVVRELRAAQDQGPRRRRLHLHRRHLLARDVGLPHPRLRLDGHSLRRLPKAGRDRRAE
ncbi:hypothetical protein EMIHUDRAFT_437070, partial [Emiliania huxleyi CCMP1516]|uniref:Uncharacterized protein n=2 Tax=Emiliania huxleyi TaxID=2903 RepID=A0A0D3IRM4_EMIH1